MKKYIALGILYCALIGLGISISIHGWGLHPVSWAWIIGGNVAGIILGGIIGFISVAMRYD